jgi:lauroyl/myristoyl acyltransferase
MMAHGFRADFDLSSLLKSFRFDDSFVHLEQAYAKGKGVMVVAGHLCGYPSVVTVISTRLPCAVYSRRNKDSRKVEIMEAIAKAGKVEVIYRPESSNRAEKLQPVIDVLRQGKMLFITPDTPRKPYEGVAVSILGKTAYFPTGVFVMSMRTGAPVVPVWWRWEQDCYQIRFSEPIELSRGGGRIREKAEAGMKQWSCQLDTFIRAYPEMWWNWLDKRWTRIIRNHDNLK